MSNRPTDPTGCVPMTRADTHHLKEGEWIWLPMRVNAGNSVSPMYPDGVQGPAFTQGTVEQLGAVMYPKGRPEDDVLFEGQPASGPYSVQTQGPTTINLRDPRELDALRVFHGTPPGFPLPAGDPVATAQGRVLEQHARHQQEMGVLRAALEEEQAKSARLKAKLDILLPNYLTARGEASKIATMLEYSASMAKIDPDLNTVDILAEFVRRLQEITQ